MRPGTKNGLLFGAAGAFIGLMIGLGVSSLVLPSVKAGLGWKRPVWNSEYSEDRSGEHLKVFRNGAEVAVFHHQFDHFKFSVGEYAPDLYTFDSVVEGSVGGGDLLYLRWEPGNHSKIQSWSWIAVEQEQPEPFYRDPERNTKTNQGESGPGE